MKSFALKWLRFGKREYLRIIAILFIFTFALLPLVTLLFNIKGEDLSFVLSDKSFGESILNSVIYSLAASVITTVLATITAYLINNSSIKYKNLFVVLLTLGMLVPTVSIGLGVRIMFGEKGFLDILFGIKADARGFLGLILGSVITAFPTTFLIIYDALKYEDKGPYDAANIMGISRISTFFKVTLPYLKIALVSAFFACFTLVFSDYGIPMELANKVNTLPMYLYNQFNTMFQYGRGSIVGLVLLLPAIVSFLFDIIFKDTSVVEKQKMLIKAKKGFNIATIITVVIVSLLLFTPQLAFVSLTFIKAFPNDMSFTFDHVANIFSNTHGVGLTQYIINSLLIAFLSAAIGTAFAYFLGYMSVRKQGKMSKLVDLFSLSTIAIPGIVLGVGYIFMFSKTNGWFYGTFAILVMVNMFHFLGSPYLLAKNSLAKINKDYEVVGQTLGISRAGIIFKVLIPNSITTLIEMFAYIFMNSMITISAVAFLCTYDTQPLSIVITTYEKNSNYEMQSVISFTILIINVFFRILFNTVSEVIKKIQKKEVKRNMELTRYYFDFLTYLEKNGKKKYPQRSLADALGISIGSVNKTLKELEELDYVTMNSDNELYINENGLKALEPYKVRKAIILAAGFGSRLAPVTLDTPKPLVKVHGERIIDSLLDALMAKGITNIVIVRGYKKEAFDVLLEKYPTIQFIDSDEFNVTNNISSMIKAIDRIDRCYVCEADLLISNPEIINKYEFHTNYLGAKVNETDDWAFDKVNGYAKNYRRGGTDCYQAFGVSYWNEADSATLRADLLKVFNSRGGKENFWEAVPLKIYKKDFKVEIRKCHKSDIIEIDSFQELLAVDDSYSNYPGYENFE